MGNTRPYIIETFKWNMRNLILPFSTPTAPQRKSKRMPKLPPQNNYDKLLAPPELKKHPLNLTSVPEKVCKEFDTQKKALSEDSVSKTSSVSFDLPTTGLTIEALKARNDFFKSPSSLLSPYLKKNEDVISLASTSRTTASTRSTLSNTEELFNKFIPFASGGMGQLIKAVEKNTNREVLIKTVKKNKAMKSKDVINAYQSLIDEYAIQSLLIHDNILEAEQLVGSANHSEKRCIVLPKLNGPDLFDFMARDEFKPVGLTPALSEDISVNLMRQMFAAVAHCHENGVAHRDIKPENFVFESPVNNATMSQEATLKLIDFGGAAHTGIGPGLIEAKDNWISYQTHPGCFTYGYAAPEQLNKGSFFSAQCDMWALGIIFFQMFHKCLPMHLLGKETMDVKALAKIPEYLSSFFEVDTSGPCCDLPTCKGTPSKRKSENGDKSSISKEAYCLLSQLLTYEPDQRITAAEAINHPIFK